jgi:hypothetical protein
MPEASRLPETETPFKSHHQNGRLPSPGDSLIQAIADAVAAKIERMSGMRQRLMEVDDAATYLGMSAHALRHKAGVEIPCVRIDGKLRFDRCDLDRFVDAAKREGV